MFGSIVVGTDGSDTAGEAVRQATELAKAVGAKVYLVSAFEPVGNQRLREERQQVPEDMSWMVNEREDVNATLKEAAEQIDSAGVPVETTRMSGRRAASANPARRRSAGAPGAGLCRDAVAIRPDSVSRVFCVACRA